MINIKKVTIRTKNGKAFHEWRRTTLNKIKIGDILMYETYDGTEVIIGEWLGNDTTNILSYGELCDNIEKLCIQKNRDTKINKIIKEPKETNVSYYKNTISNLKRGK